MIEALKAWLKRRRKKKQIAKEVAAAEGLIESIELALNIELYEWQRLYIITGIGSHQRAGDTAEHLHI